jgi:hypothetical protein
MEIANSPATAASIPEPAISEPISPELVLVDPELRRALRALAFERPPLQVVADAELRLVTPAPAPEPVALPKLALPPAGQWPVAAPLPIFEPPRPRRRVLAWSRKRVVPVVLPISLALNAILIAFAVSDATVSSQPAPAPPALDAAAPGNSGQKPPATKGPARKPRDGALERKLLNLVVQAPAGKLPRVLIDSKTGLAKNGLQAVCRRENARSFLCVVQPAKHKPREGLYARYRVNRKGNGGTFTLYPYRSG